MKKISWGVALLALGLVACITDEESSKVSVSVTDSEGSTSCFEYAGAKKDQFKRTAATETGDSAATVTYGTGCATTNAVAKCNFKVPSDSAMNADQAALVGEPVDLFMYLPAGMDASAKTQYQAGAEFMCNMLSGTLTKF